MTVNSILDDIKLGVLKKRAGDYSGAINYYKSIITRAESEYGDLANLSYSIKYGIAQVWRALAKVFYILNDFQNAASNVFYCIQFLKILEDNTEKGNFGDLYLLFNEEQKIIKLIQTFNFEALMFLGACGKIFRKSSYFVGYHTALVNSMPPNEFNNTMIEVLIEGGVDIYNQIIYKKGQLPTEILH